MEIDDDEIPGSVRARGDTDPHLPCGMRANRIAADVATALASGVISSPALVINGDADRGAVDSAAVSAALDAAVRESWAAR